MVAEGWPCHSGLGPLRTGSAGLSKDDYSCALLTCPNRCVCGPALKTVLVPAGSGSGQTGGLEAGTQRGEKSWTIWGPGVWPGPALSPVPG